MFEGNQRNTCVEKKMYMQRLYCSIVQKKKKSGEPSAIICIYFLSIF